MTHARRRATCAGRWTRWPATGHVLWRIARPEAPSPLRALAQAVTVETRELPVGGKALRVVVYRPARPCATLVLNGGFVPESTDDPRLQNFASALAETGFLVLTPDYPAVRELAFTPTTIDQIRDVIRAVRARPELGGDGPLAMIGLSYMATLSLKAALRPELESPPEYLGVFGGYEDFRDLMRDVFREEYRFGETGVPVDPYGRFLVVRSMVDYFDPPPDERERIRELALWYGQRREPEIVEEAAARLSPRGRKAFEALQAFDPARSPDLWRTMLHDHRDASEALSVWEPPERLRSRLFLLHSAYDHVLPYTHSVRLHARFPSSDLVLTTLFTHVNPRLNPFTVLSHARELWKLLRVFHCLMAVRE
jgi:pimeloyl-ACP methyl ester carboxylesterase